MKPVRWILASSVLIGAIVCVSATAMAQQDNTVYTGSLFLGGHYTGIDESIKRVGEFNRGEEEGMGDVGLYVLGRRDFNMFELDGRFYDPDEFGFRGRARIEDQFKLRLDVQSFQRQRATDLLENMSVRESGNREGTAPGGKMITYEDLDPTADYGYDRREIRTQAEFRPRGADWLTLRAAHRTILESGDDQRVSSGHCSSCHMTSQTGERENKTHAFTGELEADAGKAIIGYEFNYRMFQPDGEVATVLYDSASHPVNGGAGDEFASRLNFEDTVVGYGALPEVEKMAHALKGRAQLGNGTLVGRASLATTKNKDTQLKATATGGVLQYAVRTSAKTSLRARVNVRRVENDDYFVDVPTWRDGRGGGGQDFDFLRQSAMTRTEFGGNLELKWKAARRTTAKFLAGYESIDRDNFPFEDAEKTTTRLIGQTKVTHRASRQATLRFGYRLELTDKPFTHYSGVYETRGNGVLELNDVSNQAYYYQREQLKTMDVTTEPTSEHRIDASVALRPSSTVSLNLGLKIALEANSDLDSIDYERTLFQPNATITLAPDPKWSLYGSYTFTMDESNLPVLVPLMDG